jgi:hypothetical protein
LHSDCTPIDPTFAKLFEKRMNIEVGHSFPRAVRLGTTPQYGVLLTSLGDRARLDASLAILDRCCARLGADVVVAVARGPEEIDDLVKLYPGMRFVTARNDATVAELRELGMQHVSGDIVLLQHEDTVTTTWADELEQRMRSLHA